MENQIITIILSSIFGGGGISTLLYFIFKNKIDNHFAKNLKEYEHKLSLLKMKNEIQFSNVYTKRAEIIAEVYASLHRVRASIYKMNTKREILEEDKREFLKHFSPFAQYIGENNIYFSKDIRNQLSILGENYLKPILLKEFGSNTTQVDVFNEEYIRMIKNIKEADIQSIEKELIKEFQKLLGIEEEK